MSKSKAKKLVPPIFFKFKDDIALNFLLKTQCGHLTKYDVDFLYRAWGIEKSGIDTWQFVTNQYEAWASTRSNRAKIVKYHGKTINRTFKYVATLNQSPQFVREVPATWKKDWKVQSIVLDYGVDNLIDEIAARIKIEPNYYDRMAKKVEQLAKGIPIIGHTNPIAVDAHGYLQFI